MRATELSNERRVWHDLRMKVLVVDDEVRLTQALARGLRAEGFEVVVAHDGLHGQEAAESGSFDVIVLDIMIPGRNGYAVCKNLRDQGITGSSQKGL